VTGFGFFVELNELFVEGLVHISTLADDLYSYAEKQHSLIGRRTSRVYRIGDQVRVNVAAVNPGTRRIEFVLVQHQPSSPPQHLAAPATEEYPRIPIRGKRLSGLDRSGKGGSSKAGSSGSGGRGKQGGTKKRR